MADFDTMTPEEQEAIRYALIPSAIAGLRQGTMTGIEVQRVELLDTMVSKSKLDESVTLYKKIKGELTPGVPITALKEPGELTEPAYLFGSSDKPKAAGENEIILAVQIDAGYPVLEIPGGYITHRGRTLALEEEQDGIIPATIIGEKDIKTQGATPEAEQALIGEKAEEVEEEEPAVEEEEEKKEIAASGKWTGRISLRG